MASIIAFLGSIPTILSTLKQIWAWVMKVSGNDPAGHLVKIGEVFSDLNKAQTVEDKQNAAQKIQDLIHSS